MKNRLIESVIIIALLLAVFLIINLLAGAADNNLRKIDGEYYNIGSRSIKLILTSEDGTDTLADFTRLEELTIRPYKQAALRSMDLGSDEANKQLEKSAEYSFSDYTDLDDLGFISCLTGLKVLDVSCCAVDDLSFISDMKGLEKLNISHTLVSDISSLSDMDSITELVITDIPADDISVILEMDSLADVSTDIPVTDELMQKLVEKGVTVRQAEAKK